jgi:putative hydrolase of the HAD superfamily
VDAVLFDLFETLFTEWRGTPDGPPRWGVPGAELGVDEQEFRRAWAALQSRRMTSPFPYVDALAEICQSLGHEPPMAAIRELDALRCADKSSCFNPIDDEILDMLTGVKRAGLGMAIVSNCSVEEVLAFEQSPLASLVDEVVWSFEVGVAKPDPSIFLAGCERLAVAPAACYFVGDGSFGELGGAEAAGLTPLWASWYVNRWPERLAVPRRSAVGEAGHTELVRPSDLLRLVDGPGSTSR